jgi:hypothetical protein
MAPHSMQMPVSVITILRDRPSGALADTFKLCWDIAPKACPVNY